jgi:hypothetical protein
LTSHPPFATLLLRVAFISIQDSTSGLTGE